MTPAAVLARYAIRAYQLVVSPLLPGACRYHPSCSQYAIEAVTRFGLARGLWLAARRIGRCHPWSGFGFDPVPAAGRGTKGTAPTGTGAEP